MTNKEFRHLSKGDLIEIILQMKKTENELRSELEIANRKLEDKCIMIQESGSIAEAALRINGLFEAAQNAAEMYLQSIQANYDDIENHCKRKLEETEERCRQMEENAERRADEVWEKVEGKTQEYLTTHNELAGLLSQFRLDSHE